MTQDQIKQAISVAMDIEESMSRSAAKRLNMVHEKTLSKALLLRDAQLAIALEALDWYTNHLLPDNRPKTGIRARETITKIKEMETR